MFPHSRSIGKHEDEEEERRVLYVAMTRANRELILTRTCEKRGYTVLAGGATGTHSDGGTAYFLDRLPDELVEAQTVGFLPTCFNANEVIQPCTR